MIRLARKYHKWLMAFVGIQFLFWSVTGFYMVSVDIHYIHGESLQKGADTKVDLGQVSYTIPQLLGTYPEAKEVNLGLLMSKPVYRFRVAEPESKSKWHVIDAKTGQILPEIDKTLASEIARFYYAEQHQIKSLNLITDEENKPSELSARHLPVWQVKFEHFNSPTFYVSQQSGRIVTKRHDFWRLFDWMWRFHIMDYDDGQNVSNWFLLVVGLLGLVSAISGLVLTYIRVVKSKEVNV